MAVRPIRIYGDPVLRRKALRVREITPEIRELVADMMETMHEAPGVGLAAPQVGVSLRIIVVDPTFGEGNGQGFAAIDPVLSNFGETMVTVEERCLSIPDIWADVTRPATVSMDYLTIEGEAAHVDAEEMLARVIQHEYDHLEGILFIDRISPVRRRLLSKPLKALTRSQRKANVPA